MTRKTRKDFKCLFCDKPARSKEHVFPAALGGRRVDKGIFCADDNSKLGGLAAVLVEQLSFVNARLGVVSDNTGKARVHRVVDDETGIAFDLAGQSVEVAEPTVLSDEPSETGRAVRMLFGSQQQVDEWLRQQKAAGFDVNVVGTETKQHLFSKGIGIPMSLGGPEGLRAIAYLGLTYLAHFKPDLVRDDALLPFLGYVKDGTGEGFVWWEGGALTLDGQLPSYRFQHRIAISLDSGTGMLSGHVDLFSAFSFGIKFGIIKEVAPFTIVVDINPMVETPPKDRVVRETEGSALFNYAGADASTAKLAANIQQGFARDMMTALLTIIDNWHWEQEAPALASRLNAVTKSLPMERHGLLMKELEGQSQRLFNLLNHIATTFKQQHGAEPGMDKVSEALDRMLVTDTQDRETANVSKMVLNLAHMVVAWDIERILESQGRISEADLRSLLMGPRGLGLLGTMMFRALGLSVA